MHIGIWLFGLTCWACSLTASSYKWEVSAVCIFQNEDRFLKEWIEFHKLVGVDHFYMYNNCSNDSYQQVLKPYVDAGIVELIDWNYTPTPEKGWCTIQCSAYMDAVRRSKSKSRWLAIIDTDEFLFPVQQNSLQNFLKDFRKYAGVGVNWQMFGTSNVSCVPSDKLMIEMLTLQGAITFSANIHIKSIVQPSKVLDCKDPHYVIYKAGCTQVNADKVAFTGPYSPCIVVDKIRINHYWLRDEDFMHNVKIPRRKNWGDQFDFIQMNNNLSVLHSDAILRYVPTLQRIMFKKG